ncbi:MAG: hypothetical protein IPG58_09825 [Acidobacteria bacterium]|nr:hypothetical protein [Acidobacteriota bacterium]
MADIGAAIRNGSNRTWLKFSDAPRGDSDHAKRASESLEILLMGMDFKSGDRILTTTQNSIRE